MSDRDYEAELRGLLDVFNNHNALLHPDELSTVDAPDVAVETRWVTSEDVEQEAANRAHS